MVDENNTISIDKYLNMLFRHKMILIISFVLIGSGGTFITYQLPNVYRSSTLILVEPQKIPESYVQSTITSDVRDRMNTLTQQIMSRTRLQKIINEFSLYKNIKGNWEIIEEKFSWTVPLRNKMKKKKNNKEDTIALMRKNIKIDVRNSGRQGTTYFTINYSGKNPQIVMDVTNKLASLFIEENLKIRELQVKGTTEFLERELEGVKQQLEEKEEAVRTFRLEYMGELPEQMQTTLRIIDQLQMRIQSTTDSLQRAKDRKILVQNQISDIELTVKGKKDPAFPSETSLEVQLEQLKTQLADLKLKYTDKHPDIKKIKKNIEDITKRIEDNKSEKKKGDQAIPLPSLRNSAAASSDPLYRSLLTQLESTNLEIRSLTKEKKKMEEKMKSLQAKIEKIPRREQQLIKLTRDYELMKNNYQSLFGRKLQAQLSENLEKKQKGEQFRILDPANFPERPYKPNRQKLIILSLLSGLGVGIGLIVLIEFMDSSFYDADDVEKFTKLPILAAIPTIDTKK